MDLAIATYSHSNAKDVWPMFMGQVHKYITFLDHYFMSDLDGISETIGNNIHFLQYYNEDPYWKQFCDCLRVVPTKYVLTMYEDHILYNNVNENEIKKLVEFLENSEEYCFCRLCRSDIHHESYIQEDMLEVNPSSTYFYSMQPTIWNREVLLKCIEDSKIESIFDEPKVSNSLRKFNIKGACAYKGEVMAGKNHYWSDLTYPVVEVIARGRWIRLYWDILGPLFEEYKINPSVRGIR